MTTSSPSFAVGGPQPFLAPAFVAPRSQQSLSDYPPLALFAAAEQAQQQELQRQQQSAQSPAYQPATSPLNLSINPKLPSLEGLLKQMQTTSPTSSVAPSPQHPRLSPVSRDLAPMPSLRAMISPNMAKRVLSVSAMPQAPLPGVAAFASPEAYPQMSSSMGPSFPGKKRSWADASPVQHAMYPVKPRASPSHASGTHRSRASKYCKIEGCERVSQRNNLCHSHGGKRLCKEEGCSSKDRGNGFCIKHGGGKICSMAGCEKKARRKGLCTQHFRISDEHSSESVVSSPYATEHNMFRSV
ncbi:WRKY transcription factor 19 [Phytophthora cinnamomi]|uniref:WRKY transcription factor 19 n=1 Tax=Phytophthora cinnamomi TaxID=4785 RepID=UPI00355AADF4|nr:WRKY transcription factor 19 [Phytophthora cinnamomi]